VSKYWVRGVCQSLVSVIVESGSRVEEIPLGAFASTNLE
jgi:hypothetical protein